MTQLARDEVTKNFIHWKTDLLIFHVREKNSDWKLNSIGYRRRRKKKEGLKEPEKREKKKKDRSKRHLNCSWVGSIHLNTPTYKQIQNNLLLSKLRTTFTLWNLLHGVYCKTFYILKTIFIVCVICLQHFGHLNRLIR